MQEERKICSLQKALEIPMKSVNRTSYDAHSVVSDQVGKDEQKQWANVLNRN